MSDDASNKNENPQVQEAPEGNVQDGTEGKRLADKLVGLSGPGAPGQSSPNESPCEAHQPEGDVEANDVYLPNDQHQQQQRRQKLSIRISKAGRTSIASDTSLTLSKLQSQSLDDGQSVEAQQKERQEVIDSVSKLTASSQAYPESLTSTSRKNSSLFLRKLPTDILLVPSPEFETGFDSDGEGEDVNLQQSRQKVPCVHSLCLSPKYTLRTQLLLSFGSVSVLVVAMMIMGSILSSIYVGNHLKSVNEKILEEDHIRFLLATTARYLAESIEQRFVPQDLLRILEEATMDRMQGYPDTLWDGSVQQVPFKDMVSGNNIYPIEGKPMPLHWQIPADINDENHIEHVQQRYHFFRNQSAASTANGAFHMQGTCDPDDVIETDPFYWPNCTPFNNNITTGGVIQPVPSTLPLYHKSSDIVPLLKAMFEFTEEIQDIRIHFANMGAGATTSFPAYPLFDRNMTYNSNGCGWMEEQNPLDPSLGSIGTPEEMARCRRQGDTVPYALYNPLEDPFCGDQALNPNATMLRLTPDGRIVSLGRAIYDRQTKAFIACTELSISLSILDEVLQATQYSEQIELTLIEFDISGRVIASTSKNFRQREATDRPYTVDQLRVGLDRNSYDKLYEDLPEKWHRLEGRGTPPKFFEEEDGFFVSVWPIPRPSKHGESYSRPKMLVMLSAPDWALSEEVEVFNEGVDDQVSTLILYSIVIGVLGLIITTTMLLFMANVLTAPLHYINQTADNIVNNFGNSKTVKSEGNGNSRKDAVDKNTESANDGESSQLAIGKAARHHKTIHDKLWFTPKTELGDVLEEFDKMVETFSGSLLAKSEKGKHVEVRNKFNLREDFDDLYSSREDGAFGYNLDVINHNSGNYGSDDRGFIHIGSNVESSSETKVCCGTEKATDDTRDKKCSRLFLWTTALIVTPLIFTTVSIFAIVTFSTWTHFAEKVQEAESVFVELRTQGLSLHAALRADYITRSLDVIVRDLYYLTRYYSWLLFGGVSRADSFTEILSGVEECKTYANNFTGCPFVENTICDCAWNDPISPSCQLIANGSRELQRATYSVMLSDAFTDGDRNFTSFPEVAISPETTWWLNDTAKAQGSEQGSLASGYDTLYDRLRVASAMPLFPVLYNYDTLKSTYIGQAVAFEADGLMIQFAGCDLSTVRNSAWQSNEENGASQRRPELCPLGSYGYDPRCLDWYDTGRDLSLAFMDPKATLYITDPLSATRGRNTSGIAQSATSPLIDPRTGEHVGQVLNEFFIDSVLDALHENRTILGEGGFPTLIAFQDDPLESTVVGPGFDEPGGIFARVLPEDYLCDDDTCQDNQQKFRKVVASRNLSAEVTNNFNRTKNGQQETLHVSYAPVVVKALRPLDSSNFSRGVAVSNYSAYTLALFETDDALLRPFENITKQLTSQTDWAILGLVCIMLLAVLFVVLFSYMITASITRPMLSLLDLISCINRSDVDRELPKIEQRTGSKEITSVSDTVVVLYKIVRAANDFFFAGELEMAYMVLVDALKLFKKLDNQKAVAVASNNLGNVLLAMYNDLKETGEHQLAGLTKQEIIVQGTGHFHEAIRLGEKAYDKFYVEEGWTHNCLDFMQHLSNRYFNRALFLLMVKDDHDKPLEIEKLGMRDLVISRDMDSEIVEYGEDICFNQENRSHKLFSVDLVRARGHNMLLEMGYPDEFMVREGYPDDWELGERLDEYFNLLKTENHRDSSELFKDVNVLGRLQEIETELMKYKMMNEDVDTAAKIAIRMLREDAYVFAEALSVAVNVLHVYVDTMDLDDDSRSRVKRQLLGCINKLDDDLLGILDEESRGTTFTEELSIVRPPALEYRRSNSLRKSSFIGWVKNKVSGGFVIMEDF